MRKGGLSPSAIRQSFFLFQSILDAAVRDKRLPSNPAHGVDLPRLPKSRRVGLTHVQLAALANACGQHGLLVRVLGFTGLRWGELAALRVRNVNARTGRLSITEAMTEVNGHRDVGSPKTHQHRDVVVPKSLRAELAQQIADKGPDDLAFPAPKGGYLRVSNFRRSTWDRACLSIGLADRVKNHATGKYRYVGLTPHELRHAAATLAIAAGASIKAVQSMLGHASATLTLDTYGHLFGDELDAVADRLDAAAGEIPRTFRGLRAVPGAAAEAV